MESAKPVHAGAFCLITYRSADGRLEERIWNSRDGIKPFMVYARDGETPLQHAHSRIDQYSASQQSPRDFGQSACSRMKPRQAARRYGLKISEVEDGARRTHFVQAEGR